MALIPSINNIPDLASRAASRAVGQTGDIRIGVQNTATNYDPLTGGVAQLIGNLWLLAIIIGGLVFLVYLLFGGLQWITSGGDKSGLESARGKITNALIGLGILVASFVIIEIVEIVFGINILDPAWPTPFTAGNPLAR